MRECKWSMKRKVIYALFTFVLSFIALVYFNNDIAYAATTEYLQNQYSAKPYYIIFQSTATSKQYVTYSNYPMTITYTDEANTMINVVSQNGSEGLKFDRYPISSSTKEYTGTTFVTNCDLTGISAVTILYQSDGNLIDYYGEDVQNVSIPQDYIDYGYCYREPYYLYCVKDGINFFLSSHTEWYADSSGNIHTSSQPDFLQHCWGQNPETQVWERIDKSEPLKTYVKFNVSQVQYNNWFVSETNVALDNIDDFMPYPNYPDHANSVINGYTGNLQINDSTRTIDALDEYCVLYNPVYDVNVGVPLNVNLVRQPLLDAFGLEIGKSNKKYELQWTPLNAGTEYIEVLAEISRSDSEQDKIVYLQEWNTQRYGTKSLFINGLSGKWSFDMPSITTLCTKLAWGDWQNIESAKIYQFRIRKVVVDRVAQSAKYGNWVQLQLGYNSYGVKEITSSQVHEGLIDDGNGGTTIGYIPDTTAETEQYTNDGELLNDDSKEYSVYGIDQAFDDSADIFMKLPEWMQGYIILFNQLFPVLPQELREVIPLAMLAMIIIGLARR